jgi:hypothetical protein
MNTMRRKDDDNNAKRDRYNIAIEAARPARY